MRCERPRPIPGELKPAAIRLLAMLPQHGTMAVGIHTKRYLVAKALRDLGMVHVAMAPKSGVANVSRHPIEEV